MPSVLIVRERPDVPAGLQSILRTEGYETSVVTTGAQALASFRRATPDLVVLHDTLPDGSGAELCRRIKADPRTARVPVVMLSERREEQGRVAALEAGADDCVSEPFSLREFTLRVRAVLRGAVTHGPTGAPRSEVGPIRVDIAAHRVYVEGAEVHLTPLEFRLLATLMANVERVLSREQLLVNVWEGSSELETRTVDTHVKRLRVKLGPARELLESVRGVGYRLVAARRGHIAGASGHLAGAAAVPALPESIHR